MGAAQQPESGKQSIDSMAYRIERRADAYAKSLECDPSASAAERAKREQEVLAGDSPLDAQVEVLLGRYEQYLPTQIRVRSNSLVFRQIYDKSGERGEPKNSPLLQALLAAELEFLGPLRLSRVQTQSLATEYEKLGVALRSAHLPGHAELCFKRARMLFHANQEAPAADRCALAEARARTHALRPGWKRALRQFSDLLCGYGHHPFKLLCWIALELSAFWSVAVLTAPSTNKISDTTYAAMTDFLNPLGGDDSFNKVLFVIESYAGTVSMSVFFALLVSSWFRL